MSAASKKGVSLQVCVARFLRDHLHPSAWWTASLTGANLGPRAGLKAKQMGVRKGWPDYLVMPAPDVVLWIEAKAGTSDLTTEQRAFRNFVKPTGRWCLARSVEDVRAFLSFHNVRLRAHPFERFPDEEDGDPLGF